MDKRDYVGKDPRNGWGTYNIFGKVLCVNWHTTAGMLFVWVVGLLTYVATL